MRHTVAMAIFASEFLMRCIRCEYDNEDDNEEGIYNNSMKEGTAKRYL